VSDLELNDPQALYRRWEESQWSPFAIDLATDAEQWRAASGPERDLVLYVLSSLMVAEERITTKFSSLVGAHGSEEEATFLATQQVDEARHMQFYARFQDEVVAAPAAIAAHVERAREHVSDAFRQIFDVALVEAHETLRSRPGDLAAKVRFVTIYHVVLEATLGLTSFKFITDYLRGASLLPGFVDGYSKIHDDETRHIAYGVWFLRSTVAAHPDQADTVRATLRELLPAVAESLRPPGDGDAQDLLGVSDDDVRGYALQGLTRRLSIIGVPIETVVA
jgi:ribonucleoside-diphosphate reductase beta chain